MRARVGPEFPVGLSLSFDEMIGSAGITPADTLAQLDVLAGAGIYDFFDLSIGSLHSEHFTIAPMDVEEGFTLEFAAQAKARVGERAAIFVAGRVVDPAMAARAVRDGVADVIAMSRAHLADPQLVGKALGGRAREIRRCIGANVCVGRALRNEPVACVLTPATGRERTWAHGAPAVVGSDAARRVAIVGGGPAGLRAGAIAAARGHHVVVHEREAEPGGHLRGRHGRERQPPRARQDPGQRGRPGAGPRGRAPGGAVGSSRARQTGANRGRIRRLCAARARRGARHRRRSCLDRHSLAIDRRRRAVLLETAHVLPRLRGLDVELTVGHDVATRRRRRRVACEPRLRRELVLRRRAQALE
jgi:NADH:flavin oxidoreductase / NADH oxidase family/NAD(P)-binding Rossmann-like domain